MLSLPLHLPALWTHFPLLVAIPLIVVTESRAPAQIRIDIRGGLVPLEFQLAQNQQAVEITQAQVDTVPGTVETRFQQVDALVRAEEWEETIDSLLDLLEEPSEQLVELSPDRFVSLHDYCQYKLANLPQQALSRYRDRVDSVAETWYRNGIAGRNVELLKRVVRDLFASSWADEALFVLGELALERADYADARSYWERISPQLRSPAGQPVWIGLHNIDLGAHYSEVERHWHDRAVQPNWLAYPDTNLDLAAVQARLVLVSLREGNLDRAKTELQVLKQWHHAAEGHFGGQTQPFAAVLEQLITGAEQQPNRIPTGDWTTFAGTTARDGISAAGLRVLLPAWNEPVQLSSASISDEEPAPDAGRRSTPITDPPLPFHPVVFGNQVFHSSSLRVRATSLLTGEPAITADGVLYQVRRSAIERGTPVGTRVAISGTANYTASVHSGILFARVGSNVTSQSLAQHVAFPDSANQTLVGLDLDRDGLLTFQVTPDSDQWAFEGAPVCDGQHVYVAMRHSDVKPRAYVVCFDLPTGRCVWRTPICAADTPASGRGDEVTHGLLTLVGSTIYYNTNLGAVAAMDKFEGRLHWLQRYDRFRETTSDAESSYIRRQPSPCIYTSGLLFVAPADSPLIFALDASTGMPLWVTDLSPEVEHLIGVVGDRLIATGKRCWSLDVLSGEPKFVWPESPMAGIRGRGRGCIDDANVYWPTRRDIYVLNATTGALARPTIPLTRLGDDGANLVAAGGYLLAASADKLFAFGPQAAPRQPLTSDVAVQLRALDW